jgi:hypothetical protein
LRPTYPNLARKRLPWPTRLLRRHIGDFPSRFLQLTLEHLHQKENNESPSLETIEVQKTTKNNALIESENGFESLTFYGREKKHPSLPCPTSETPTSRAEPSVYFPYVSFPLPSIQIMSSLTSFAVPSPLRRHSPP